ncbi:MAG: phosphatase PAP2 family protein, partial [Vicinamibacteria bacterium]
DVTPSAATLQRQSVPTATRSRRVDGRTLTLVDGAAGARLVLEGVAAAFLDALIYRACKRRIVRPRPFQALADLPILWSPPADFSCPSGHTLHAFASAVLIAAQFPALAVPALLLAALVGASRVFLAVHYPSDVLAGAVIGTAVGAGVHVALTPLLG